LNEGAVFTRWSYHGDSVRTLLSLLPLLMSLEVTSLPHLVAETFGEEEDCCETCDDAAPGQKCPPLCPTCSCAHVAQMVNPVPTAEPALAPPAGAIAAPSSQVPEEPDPVGIFHPPRA
jgi:hypothetical protein